MGQLTISATTWTQIHGSELAHFNTFPMYDLLEHVKGLVLWNHSRRISKTQGNSRISESLYEGSVYGVAEARDLELD